MCEEFIEFLFFVRYKKSVMVSSWTDIIFILVVRIYADSKLKGQVEADTSTSQGSARTVGSTQETAVSQKHQVDEDLQTHHFAPR